ncbi:MAG: replicative DNA helicase, partial [Saprospiraceae bacterium]|nr:replicative DNA helicase [Saprospiraceae bacterium]
QDADIVTFIYRPDYYGLGEGDFDTPSDLSEIILAKHRNGGLGTVQLRFRGEFVKFENPGNDGFSMDIFKNDSYNTNIVTRPSRMNKDLSDDGFEEIPF